MSTFYAAFLDGHCFYSASASRLHAHLVSTGRARPSEPLAFAQIWAGDIGAHCLDYVSVDDLPPVQRIAVTVTASEDSFQLAAPIPGWTRPAWLDERGFLDYRDCPPGVPTCSGFRMDPPPARDSQEWHRASANHGAILAMQGGRGYVIRREPGAEWHDA